MDLYVLGFPSEMLVTVYSSVRARFAAGSSMSSPLTSSSTVGGGEGGLVMVGIIPLCVPRNSSRCIFAWVCPLLSTCVALPETTIGLGFGAAIESGTYSLVLRAPSRLLGLC